MNGQMSDKGLGRGSLVIEVAISLKGRSKLKYIMPRARQYEGKGGTRRYQCTNDALVPSRYTIMASTMSSAKPMKKLRQKRRTYAVAGEENMKERTYAHGVMATPYESSSRKKGGRSSAET